MSNDADHVRAEHDGSRGVCLCFAQRDPLASSFCLHTLFVRACISLGLTNSHLLQLPRQTKMAGPARPASAVPATRRTGLRQPTRRAGSAVPDRMTSSAVSTRPASVASTRAPKPSPEQPPAIPKRKERDYEREISGDTSIHVVVRCRGRNKREIKENSGVVLSTEGVNGTTVDLSMGPNALSNKTYGFDKVFSPAADQTIVFDDVVLPIVNEVS